MANSNFALIVVTRLKNGAIYDSTLNQITQKMVKRNIYVIFVAKLSVMKPI